MSAAAAFASCATLKADQAKLNAWTAKYNKGVIYVQSQEDLLGAYKRAWDFNVEAANNAAKAAYAADTAYAQNPNPKTLAAKNAAHAALAKAQAVATKAGIFYNNFVKKVEGLKSTLASWAQQVALWKQTVAADMLDCQRGGGHKR